LERNPSHCVADAIFFVVDSLLLVCASSGPEKGLFATSRGGGSVTRAASKPLALQSSQRPYGTGLLPSLRLAARTARENSYYRPGAAIFTHVLLLPDNGNKDAPTTATSPLEAAELSQSFRQNVRPTGDATVLRPERALLEYHPHIQVDPTFASWAPDDDNSASLTQSAASKEAVCTPFPPTQRIRARR
jgi:hypothetical protein